MDVDGSVLTQDMQVTKWQHAALVIEVNGRNLVIDPGAYSPAIEVADVDAIVVTHEHQDHWTPEQLTSLRARSPGVRIFTTAATAEAASAHGIDVEIVHPGERVSLGEFSLVFTGGKHALIHSSIPIIDNLAVLVNERLYYAGDSFAVPEFPVDVLAAPASAPWLKIGDAMDYVLRVRPNHVFQIHEAVNSELGNQLASARLQWAATQVGATFTWMEPGQRMQF